MVHVPEVVTDLYYQVPKACFVSGVPFTLRGHDDNRVIPSFDTVPGPDGVQAKWIRFCDFLPFVDACRSYWLESESTEHPIDHPLYVYVMPYSPLRDSYYLHELIQNADPLPPDASASEHMAVQALILDHDQESAAADPRLMQGVVEVADGVTFTFTVVNYRLLLSKAQIFSIMSYVSNPLDECMRRMDLCANLLRGSAPGPSTEQLVCITDDARRRLAVALLEAYAQGDLAADPHDAIYTMFPAMHDEVYQEHCHHCQPHLYQEDPAATNTRLELAMDQLGSEEQDTPEDLPIRQAEYNLMDAESILEFHDYNVNVRAKFSNSRNIVATAINPTRNYIRECVSCHTLVGVLARYEDANPAEGN
ncbi:uncharacterized protein [Lolium perenne]|uniref:uncharacterized protein n=1 Tax=Lolium perenne TaxID=4522 RepID=UPI0021F5B884|nr:uncharacterized protein LOC127311988 [Lolium perenne]